MNKVRKYRIEKYMSQEELAERCGVARTHITSIESGSYMPSVQVAKKIGQVLDFDWKEIYEKVGV